MYNSRSKSLGYLSNMLQSQLIYVINILVVMMINPDEITYQRAGCWPTQAHMLHTTFLYNLVKKKRMELKQKTLKRWSQSAEIYIQLLRSNW